MKESMIEKVAFALTAIGSLLFAGIAISSLMYLLMALGSLLMVRPVFAQATGGVRLEAGMVKEDVDGDLKSAVEIYQKIADDASAPRDVRSKALMRLAGCYEKLGRQARQVYERVVRDFADLPAATQARTRLAALTKQEQAPAPILRKLTSNSTELPVMDAAISPDGNYLAYADAAGLYLRSMKTRETRQLPSVPELSGTAIHWFPDSARLLLSGSPPPGPPSQNPSGGIWTLSLQGNRPQRISNDGWFPVASPDGAQIAYLSDGARELWLMTANGQSPHRIQVTNPGELCAFPGWLPAGDRIVRPCLHQGSSDASGKTAMQLEMEIVDLQGQKQPRLPFDPAATGGALLPGGRLLYALRSAPKAEWEESTLWERPTDPGFRAWRGEPRLVTKLGTDVEASNFSHTSDGRKLVFLKTEQQYDVYIAELEDNGRRLSNARRLTLDDHNDFLSSWSLDSRAVFFWSDRNGNHDIYRQSIDQQIAQPILVGPRDKHGVVVSPDGSWYYYAVEPEGWKFMDWRPITWMRMPSAGGPAHPVFEGPVWGGIECALPPSRGCVLVETRNELAVSSIDPEKGRGNVLARASIPGPHIPGLSPDGSRVAVPLEDRIRILDLPSGKTEDISYPDWKTFHTFDSVHWAADGKGLYTTSFRNGKTVILYMDLEGHAWPLFEARGQFQTWASASPDGRRLAFGVRTSTRNAWMIEKF
jgi:Tol biopolymer transport system component